MSLLVSICIPCYNSQNTIEKTIQCVLDQTYTNIEIIICDNASTDKTIETIKQFQDDRIKLYANETNIGMINNFQKALSLASGKYVKILCSDDIISPNCIEKQVAAFENNSDKNIVMVTSEKNVINESNTVLFKKGFPGKKTTFNGLKAIKKSFLYGTNIFGEPGCVLFDNEIAKQTSGFSIAENFTYVVDFNFFCQLLKLGNLFVIREPLFSFRVIGTSGTAGFKWQQAKIFNALIDKYHKENFISFSFPFRVISKTMAWLMCIARNIVFKFSK